MSEPTFPLVPEEILTRLDQPGPWSEEFFDEYFDAIGRLRESLDGPAAVLGLAGRLWTDPDEKMRAIGFDLLAIGSPEVSWQLTSLIEAAGALDLRTAGENLRWSAAHALGVADDERALAPLLRFARDPDSDVRWQVAAGASPSDLDLLPDEAVEVLLGLMRDTNPDVRDWATFSLGVQAENDTPEIREALAAALEDRLGDTAGEAAVALAKRGDPRVLPVLEERLAGPDVGNLYVKAAEELGDPRLLPLLRRLKERGWDVETSDALRLDSALKTLNGPPSA
ncbi:HEAT repeat domain-containing protein [Sphaerisporangium dianthi]|uniref:HEAT repeat domain-containing protein n=1 Tax=Sphaerisporangium dianthi TaxID=1436120 RepID=A0ABV9CT43_9ACTN